MAAAAAIAAFSMTGSAWADVIDLGFSLDDSGSIGAFNFNLTRDALADALSAIPTSGTNQYRIAVTQFGSGFVTLVPPTIVTASNLSNLQDDVRDASYRSGGTDTAGAISNLFGLFQNSSTGLGDTTILNITTDGEPNSQTAAENAALAAFNAGLDGLSFEAVGTGLSSSFARNNMADIASLGTTGALGNAVVLDPGDSLPNATQTGFVIGVTDFNDYEDAIAAKIGQVVIDTGGGDGNPNVIPLPAAGWLLLAGIGALGVMRRRQAAA
jgi:hypothetical protein